MNFPASVKVGYRDFRIEAWPAREASASNRFGECDRVNGVIRVRDDIQGQVIGMVALHEMLHAAYDIGDLPGADEEKVVTVMANQLAQVIRDNPEFIAFVQHVLKPDQVDTTS